MDDAGAWARGTLGPQGLEADPRPNRNSEPRQTATVNAPLTEPGVLVSLVKIPAFAGVSPCGRQISRRNKPRRGDTGKPRAQALGSGSPSQGALKGRRRAHCQYALFRPFRAPQLLLSFPGLAPWAVLRRPFGARGRSHVLQMNIFHVLWCTRWGA